MTGCHASRGSSPRDKLFTFPPFEDSTPQNNRQHTRAGNEPSRSFKFHNHEEGPYYRSFSWLKVLNSTFTFRTLCWMSFNHLNCQTSRRFVSNSTAHSGKNERDSISAYRLLKLSRAPVLSSCPQWRRRYFTAKEMDRHSITAPVSAQYINVFITHCPAKLTFLKWPWKMSCMRLLCRYSTMRT